MTAPQEKPRLYYDCPLKAAYMAKYFGMKLHDGAFVEPTAAPPEEIASWGDGAIYIHTDSLPLLEPIEGDVIHRTNGYHQTVGFNIGIPKAAAQIAAGGVIIQRAGKPFMWPEEEA